MNIVWNGCQWCHQSGRLRFVGRHLQKHYRQKKTDTAVKLLPPESIVDGTFTEKSDVVSAHATSIPGIEDKTGGHIPYSGISPVALLQLLHNGKKLNKPMNPACSDEM